MQLTITLNGLNMLIENRSIHSFAFILLVYCVIELVIAQRSRDERDHERNFNQSTLTHVGRRARPKLATNKNQQQHETRSGDRRVPFWNIAHMINSIDQIEPALR